MAHDLEVWAMSSVPVKAGDPVPLSIQLDQFETDKYPQAFVKDDAGAPVAGSPFDLTSTGDGMYVNNSGLIMPNEPLWASYKVFDDAGHTIFKKDAGADLFIPNRTEATVDQLLTMMAPPTLVLGAVISAGTLVGVIKPDETLSGLVTSQALYGEVSSSPLVGALDEEVLTGIVVCK
jgi:hypothetical protein